MVNEENKNKFFIHIFSFTEITSIAYLHHLGQDSNSILLFHCSPLGALANIRFPNGQHDLHLVLVCLFFFLPAPIFSFHGRLDWKEHEPDWVGMKFETNANSKQVVGELFYEKTELEAKAITVNSKHGRWGDCMLIMVTGLSGVQFGL